MPRRVIFLHPDLGIGGAERLVLDAAFAAHSGGYEVKVITNHHDANHCFADSLHPELNLRVVGSWLPRSLFGHCIALCAYLRFLIASFYLLVSCNRRTDIVFVDQIPIALPLLYVFGYKTFFYCHFPDLLLTDRKSWPKRLYRLPIDWLEEWSIGWADMVAVNSNFTAGIFHQTFKRLRHIDPAIVYPVANASNLALPLAAISPTSSEGGVTANQQLSRRLLPVDGLSTDCDLLLVSINRFERKKRIELALYSLKYLLSHWNQLVKNENSEKINKPTNVKLIIAGGYDQRLAENVSYHNELLDLTHKLELDDHVTFIKSFSAEVKALLISASDAIVYTPEGEHFGIVPVEAMLLSRPVIALNSGGPRETVVDGETGLLCDDVDQPDRLMESMARKFACLINDRTLVARLGEAGLERAMAKFSFNSLVERLNCLLTLLFDT